MKPSFFDTLATKRADYIARVDAIEFAPAIRNHLLQLFRAAHAVEPTLKGVMSSNGTAIVRGEYLKTYEDGESLPESCTHWHPDSEAQPKHPETRALLAAVFEYANNICSGADLPYIDDITLDDLKTAPKKRATRNRRAS